MSAVMKKPDFQSTTATFEEITPEKAKDFLSRNDNNRRMNHNHILNLARTMEAGNWLVTHQGIALDVAGNLLDGQQRLSAIVASGLTQTMMVTRGLDPVAYKVLDSGRRRNDGQRLEHDGYKHTAIMAAALRFQHQHDAVNPDMSLHVPVGKRPSYQDLLDVLDQHPDAQEAAAIISNSKPLKKVITPAVCAYFMIHVLEVEGSEYAEYWRDAMANPLSVSIKEGDPIYVLRERLLDLRTGKRPPSRIEELVMVIKAWNCHRAGREKITSASIAWKKMGPRREAFPDFKD